MIQLQDLNQENWNMWHQQRYKSTLYCYLGHYLIGYIECHTILSLYFLTCVLHTLSVIHGFKYDAA